MNATESICEKARRIAREEVDLQEAARQAKRQAFLDTMFQPGDYTLNDDGTYTICGWKWELWTGDEKESPHLSFNVWMPYVGHSLHNYHRGFFLGSQSAYTLLQFGHALRSIDAQISGIDERYPDTWWGRVRLWWATH